MAAAPLNYTTKVPTSRTVGEVQALLADHGAGAVAVRYADRLPVGVSFTLAGHHGERAFALPVNVDAVHRLLTQHAEGRSISGMSKAAFTSRDHASRVAWRVAKDWLEAQLAIVQAQMVTLDQVMLPYLVVDRDQAGEVTLYDRYKASERAALPGADLGGVG